MAKAIDEKEINLTVNNLDGLLDFLRSKASEKIVKKSNIYFESKIDKSYFLRLENIETESENRKALTIKYGFNDDDSGMNRRKEMTTPVEDLSFYETMFEVMGLKCESRKSKIRHTFEINGLDISVDEWIDSELGNHVEIEGDNEEEIWKFKEQIDAFVEPGPNK